MTTFTRAFPLEDCHIRADGTGRTVVMYAALFGVRTQIQDQQGVYKEELSRSSFNRTVAQRGTQFGVFYNHGKTLYGTPSERASVPLGSPLEPPKPDGKGLLTVTRYNKSAQADEVLAAIENGDLRSQSFSGRFLDSTPKMPRGGYRASSDGSLTVVTRNEIAMTEYGPTPIPAYDEPMLVGVRSRLQNLLTARALNPADTKTLTALLARLAAADAAVDPIADAICAADEGLDDALATLSRVLGVDNPDPDADYPADAAGEPTSITSSSGRRTGTAIQAPATEDSRDAHSGRSLNARVRAALIARGIAS